MCHFGKIYFFLNMKQQTILHVVKKVHTQKKKKNERKQMWYIHIKFLTTNLSKI